MVDANCSILELKLGSTLLKPEYLVLYSNSNTPELDSNASFLVVHRVRLDRTRLELECSSARLELKFSTNIHDSNASQDSSFLVIDSKLNSLVLNSNSNF